MNDIKERRERRGTDEEGRQLINAHGDVDVVRTKKSKYPVQVPIERGDYLRLDDEELIVVGFIKDGIEFRKLESDRTFTWGIHNFNTDVRNSDEVVVKSNNPEAK